MILAGPVLAKDGSHPIRLRSMRDANDGLGANLVIRLLPEQRRGCADDRDRGTPRSATPPTPPGIRVTYHGGSTGLSLDRDMELAQADRVEVAIGQCLLDRRVSRHAPGPRWRTGSDRCIELWYARSRVSAR